MAWFTRLKKQQPGQPIEAKTLRTMAEVAEWASRLRADPPLSIATTAFGPIIRWVGMIFSVYIAVVDSGGISARAGTTPGNGTVILYNWNGTVLAPMSGTITKTAYNISSASGGIAAGKYCIILRICNDYWIITSEC